MVNVPRSSVAQAAEVLGKERAQVERMIKLGRLPRRGAPNASRVSDVLTSTGSRPPAPTPVCCESATKANQ
jgi:hypothetical protein